MSDPPDDRDEVAREGRYAVVAAGSDESPDYWLVADDDRDRRVPIGQADVDDAHAVVSKLRGQRTDVDDGSAGVALTCQECGKEWTYTGSDEHASCPNCETEVPVEGIGP